MNFEIEAGVHGRFQLTAVNAKTGAERPLTDWFNNTVLDSGLRQMTQGAWLNGVSVGTGNSAPTETQTGLDNYVARTTTVQASSSGRQVATSPYYWWARVTYRFGQGVAAGNLSEIGVGWGNNTLWNRTLIKDTSGNPTTVTILADEFLDVNFELRVYPKMTDTVKNVTYQERVNGNLVDVSTHEVTIRPLMTNDDISLSGGSQTGSRAVTLGATLGGSVSYAAVLTGALNDILTYPAGSNLSAGSSYVNNVATNPAVLKREGSQFFDLNFANGVHQSVVVPTTIGTFKFGYNPPITKNSLYQIWHNFSISWNRYTGG